MPFSVFLKGVGPIALGLLISAQHLHTLPSLSSTTCAQASQQGGEQEEGDCSEPEGES